VFTVLFPDLPGFCVEQIEKTEKGIRITARATASSAFCPDCQQASSRVHSYYMRCPMDLPSSGRPISLALQVRHFRCSNRVCPRKTFAEPLPNFLSPYAQRTFRLRESLRKLGEETDGEAGARLSKQQGMTCSASTVLRLLRHGPLSLPSPIKVVGVDEWAWRKGQRYGTLLVDLEQRVPIDLLAAATAESFAAWLQAHPSVEFISRDRGTTFAHGATRGAPQAPQIADRWHILHNLGEALEKVLARHHTDVKRAFTSPEEESQVIATLDQQALAHVMARAQSEQLRQARRERRLATFTRVQELSAQGWSGASIARMLGIHKKTAVKYAAAEHFPEARSDRGYKLAPYLPFLQAQWVAGEYNIAALYQAIRAQGYSGSETTVRNFLTALREQIGPRRRARRYYPPVSQESKHHQRTGLSSRRATWLVLRRPENCSSEDLHTLDLLKQAHPQVRVACELAQAFAQMIRKRNASALESWLEEATDSGIPELRTFATGIKRDQAAILAALTYAWSQGQVEGKINRLKLIKRQAYGRAGFDLLRHRVVARSA
jgi:transposase